VMVPRIQDWYCFAAQPYTNCRKVQSTSGNATLNETLAFVLSSDELLLEALDHWTVPFGASELGYDFPSELNDENPP
jgi:hypothetical protein